jgi:hypothetical protein
MKSIILVIVLVFVFSLSFSGQCTTVSYLPPSPTLLGIERCSGSTSPGTSDCTGIMRVKIKLTNGSQLLFWGIPAPESWVTSAPGITWTPVK